MSIGNIKLAKVKPEPNNETLKAIADVINKKGTKAKNSKELFTQLGI